MPQIVVRSIPPQSQDRLVREGVHPVLARIFAARGIREPGELDAALGAMLAPEGLLGADRAAARLADAIGANERILIVADFDCDGATACALGMRALHAFGASVDYVVPDRFRYGYGLTPEIVTLAARSRPGLIVTVDNGIASIDGVERARELGIEVLVTDHHLPGRTLPLAAAIVNPNQPGCAFASKHLAGVGVMFYVMLALRAELRRRGAFREREEPLLADLLDLVALGTVADVVRLDRNNRVLVSQGLKRIRAGRMQPGVRALFAAAGRDPQRASSFDLGFLIGPRINAAGRLEDMGLGIECLATDDYGRALSLARSLDELNRERRTIEAGMREQAEAFLSGVQAGENASLCLFDRSWHQGVIGILAGRLRDRLHRPVIAFAPGTGNDIKGSGRSIPALNLRDALDLLAKRSPGLLQRFGGHAAAAGLTLDEADFPRFEAAFESVVRELVAPADLAQVIETDGSLEPAYMNLDTAAMLDAQIWGQGFPRPLFVDEFEVVKQRVVGDKHLKLRLARGPRTLEAMRFNALDTFPPRMRAAYRLAVNEYNGAQTLQLVIEHWERAA